MSTGLLPTLSVAVVGAGISGVATAASLVKLGCKRVTVYDTQPSLSALHRSHPSATVLQANGARVLDALDALSALSAHASAIQRITQRNTRGRQRLSFSPSAVLRLRAKDGRALTSLASPYAALHSALASQLPAHAVRWSSEVTAVERDGSGHRLLFTSSTAPDVQADVVVAADGADSSLRPAVRAGEAIAAQPMGATLAEGVSGRCEVWEEQGDNELLEVWGAGQRVGAVRLPDGSTYWYATVSNGAESSHSPSSLAASLSALPAWVTGMMAATPASSYSARPLRHLQPSAPLYRDGVVLLGSASALLPTDLHQQVAASLESALTLALSLDCSTSIAAGLQRYSSLRLPRLASLHSSSLAECRKATTSGLLHSLRSMGSSLLPAQVKQAVHEAAVGYDVLKPFPAHRALLGRAKARLSGQAGQLLADRLETDLGDWDDKWAAEQEEQRKQRSGGR